jgi:hypothetical protein
VIQRTRTIRVSCGRLRCEDRHAIQARMAQ